MKSQVSGLAKLGLGKSFNEIDMHHHTYHFANKTYHNAHIISHSSYHSFICHETLESWT